MVAIGIQNDGLPVADVLATGAAIHAKVMRVVSVPGQEGIADRIRAAHDAGVKVILTVGGNGTSVPHPTVKATLRWIHQLPRADKYTWTNEPDYVGPTPCVYRRRWMRLRRALGRRLLWGDFSPLSPVTFTIRAKLCGHLPATLDIGDHSYQPDDPMSPTAFAPWSQGALGNLGRARHALASAGVHVRWWLTEFGYGPHLGRTFDISDERAAWLWPRAIRRANDVGARVLVVYTAEGPSWDTRPRPAAWSELIRSTT